MSRFLDGPAAGVSLSLGRSPVFLRVVRDPSGKWDALDQLGDSPAPNEEIHVYWRVSDPVIAHVDGRNPKTGKRYGSWMSIADYVLHDAQPADDVARDKAAWPEWCSQQGKMLAAAPPAEFYRVEYQDDSGKWRLWKDRMILAEAQALKAKIETRVTRIVPSRSNQQPTAKE